MQNKRLEVKEKKRKRRQDCEVLKVLFKKKRFKGRGWVDGLLSVFNTINILRHSLNLMKLFIEGDGGRI